MQKFDRLARVLLFYLGVVHKIKELCTAWNVSSRNILGLDARTRTYLISTLMKAMPIRDIIMHRMMSFFLNGIDRRSNVISYFFKNLLTSSSSVMLRNVNTILQEINIKYNDIFQINKNFVLEANLQLYFQSVPSMRCIANECYMLLWVITRLNNKSCRWR